MEGTVERRGGRRTTRRQEEVGEGRRSKKCLGPGLEGVPFCSCKQGWVGVGGRAILRSTGLAAAAGPNL